MRFVLLIFMMFPFMASANILPLNDALRATYIACVGIDDELSDLKVKAGINTAVTAVGTAAGVGATVTGIVKASKDKQIEQLEMERLRKIAESGTNSNASNGKIEDNLLAIQSYYDAHKNDTPASDIDTEIDKLTEQSKKLGNWRTGLLAGSTATNIAGAAISGTNKVSVGLKEQINSCISAVDSLQQSIMQARLNGEDITEAQSIVEACEEYKYVDLSKIDNRAKGAMISSVVGAGLGLAGTITSASANSKDVRDGDSDKEKNLNTAANVLSGVTTAASATATGFNAAQISAIKKVAEVAEKCTGVLK